MKSELLDESFEFCHDSIFQQRNRHFGMWNSYGNIPVGYPGIPVGYAQAAQIIVHPQPVRAVRVVYQAPPPPQYLETPYGPIRNVVGETNEFAQGSPGWQSAGGRSVWGVRVVRVTVLPNSQYKAQEGVRTL